jgi:hypothetical protein
VLIRTTQSLDSPGFCGTGSSLSERPHQFELTGVKALPKASRELANTYLPASVSFVMESQREACGPSQHLSAVFGCRAFQETGRTMFAANIIAVTARAREEVRQGAQNFNSLLFH